jgi:general stress protein YciG
LERAPAFSANPEFTERLYGKELLTLDNREDHSKMAQESGQAGGMSVREAGRRGGERVKAKYGSEFYEEIGRKGGEATKSKYGPSFYEVIGQKGGQRPKRKAAAS